jgi:hypothetical protein
MSPFAKHTLFRLAMAIGLSSSIVAHAFDSGSTGADGAYSPAASEVKQLPPSGIFNFTTVNIPAGVTVTVQRNATNTPIIILATGNVTIAGTISVSGGSGTDTGAGGSGNIGDDGTPGKGGPGGFDGGRGAASALGALGGNGLGPGGGGGGIGFDAFPGSSCPNPRWVYPGAGGGFGSAGSTNFGGCSNIAPSAGSVYGSSVLLPLIGGSGGGGGSGGADFGGSGGGGGGGAILIASSGTVNITGAVRADGGSGGNLSGADVGASGGGGSGGAIRIVATTISGNGVISAQGGSVGSGGNSYTTNYRGGGGRIRLEADTYTRTATSNPAHSFSAPGPVFIAGFPTLTITSVAGIQAPANPTGTADITLPATTTNPVTVVFNTTNVPVGNTVKLTLTPHSGAQTSVIGPALIGSTASASSSAQITIPVGPSTMLAETTYTIVASLGDALRNFAGNERVEKITLSATLGGESKMKLITVSGKEYDAPPEALRIAAMGG